MRAHAPVPTSVDERRTDVVLGLIFAAALGFAAWSAHVGFSHSILDAHPLRQTRTALSVESMIQSGSWLRYETPIFGPPWALPFELPVYQWLVAAVVRGLGLHLEQAGRLVNVALFAATLIPVNAVLRGLRVRGPHRLVFFSLMVASPLYLFWSRTVMIESTALLAGFWYLGAVGWFLQSRRPGPALVATAIGCLAAAIKVTTFFGFLLAACLYALRLHSLAAASLQRRPVPSRVRQLLYIGCIVVLPICAALLWTVVAERIRQQNLLAGEFLTSATELRVWAWGDLADRYSPLTWGPVWSRTVPDVVGGHLPLGLALVGLVLSRRRPQLAAACGVLFVVVVLAFPRLHRVHDYYAYENGVFLLAFVGWAVVGLLECGGWRSAVGIAILLVTLGQCLDTFRRTGLAIQQADVRGPTELVNFIRSATTDDEVILIYGEDWSPMIPYLAHRRAVMDRALHPLESPIMVETRRRLTKAGLRIGAMLMCGASRADLQGAALASAELDKNGLLTEGRDGKPERWRSEGYATDATEYVWTVGDDGLGLLGMTSAKPNDARWVQSVPVSPGTWYQVSGWVRAQDVGAQSLGAYLSVMDTFFNSRDLRGTTDWQQVGFWVKTGSLETSLALACRLGGYSSLNTGTAHCTGLSVVAAGTPRAGDPFVFGGIAASGESGNGLPIAKGVAVLVVLGIVLLIWRYLAPPSARIPP